jgi:aminoglycoside phosphotransferase
MTEKVLGNGPGTRHGEAKATPINNTFVKRMLTIIADKTLGRLLKSDGVCRAISKSLLIKAGPSVHLMEANTMQYIAANTSIPVPKVYCSFVHKGMTYILMERIRGKEIFNVFKLPESSREKVFVHLETMIQEMRALEPPPGAGVQNCMGGSLYDSRISKAVKKTSEHHFECKSYRFGPFSTIRDFHFWLRDDMTPEDLEDKEQTQDWQDLKDMMELQDGPSPPPVFTHGDLNPCNILIRDEKVVAIIDWEFAGWYPHYWEYTSAWFGNRVRTGWQDVLDKFLKPCPAEFAMETTRNKWWGEF